MTVIQTFVTVKNASDYEIRNSLTGRYNGLIVMYLTTILRTLLIMDDPERLI